MGYRRGYDCDICGKSSEKELEFIGLSLSSGCSQTCVVDADFHVCIRCAKVLSDAVQTRFQRMDPTP